MAFGINNRDVRCGGQLWRAKVKLCDFRTVWLACGGCAERFVFADQCGTLRNVFGINQARCGDFDKIGIGQVFATVCKSQTPRFSKIMHRLGGVGLDGGQVKTFQHA